MCQSRFELTSNYVLSYRQKPRSMGSFLHHSLKLRQSSFSKAIKPLHWNQALIKKGKQRCRVH